MLHRHPRLRRVVLAFVFGVGLVALLLAVGMVVLLLPVIPDPIPGIEKRKGRLVGARVTHTERLADTLLEEVRLVSSSGLQVELTVRRPVAQPATHPLVVLLGGQATGRDAARLIPETRGVVLAALSYPYRGDRDVGGLARFGQLRRAQRAILDTPPAVLLALDYLVELPGVDSQRVELVGVSLGAFLVGVPGALDPRFARVWVIHGAARPADVLERGLEPHLAFAPLRRPVARLLAAVAGSRHLAPEHWVGRIAPRPVIALNARDDEALPADCIAALHRALREPSEIVWMEGGHVNPGNREVVEELGRRIISRVLEEPP